MAFPGSLLDFIKYKLIEVPMSSLFVDYDYQRPLQKAHIQNIADNFNPAYPTPLIGNVRPDGRVALMDGQQRFSAYKMKGYADLVQVLVPVVPLSKQGESDVYLALNAKNKAPKAVDNHNAKSVSGDPIAQKINEIVVPLGIHIDSDRKPYHINAKSALEWVIVNCGGLKGRGQVVLRKTLEVLIGAYDVSYKDMTATMIKGVALFIYNVNEKYYDHDILVEVLDEYSASEWTREAKANTQLYKAVYEAVAENYYGKFIETHAYPSSIEEMLG